MTTAINTTIPTTGTGTGTTAGTGTGTTTDSSAAAAAGTAATAAGVNGAATLGGTNFLTLMLAQLKNQDPTSPVDSNTFLTQLAQLSEVQGINTLNTSFGTLSSSLTSAQTMQASSLLGHNALVTSSTATVATAGAPVTGAVTVPQTTASVTLSIANAAGTVIKTVDLGAQAAGLANFTWDGTTSTGAAAPAGTYTLTAIYGGQTTARAAATTAVNGVVDSVSMGAGTAGMTLNVAGVGSVPISALQTISN
jgi:flagellar basal-body rod modification protein FlgD